MNSKYIQTIYGTILMKSVFAEGLSTTTGEVVSTNEVKRILMECVSAEDKSNPLSDEEIARQLIQKKYSIARRTVAKYREELNIPSKNFRKAASLFFIQEKHPQSCGCFFYFGNQGKLY